VSRLKSLSIIAWMLYKENRLNSRLKDTCGCMVDIEYSVTWLTTAVVIPILNRVSINKT